MKYRCRLTARGIEAFRWHKSGRLGWAHPTRGAEDLHVTVVWDGQVTPSTYHKDFIEHVAEQPHEEDGR